jgi:23S rRNA (adenine2503-C2)-methyltransferase
MDLDLLERTLADAGEPAYRATQVWEWAARGASGYEAMSNLPKDLRARLESDVPFSTLRLDRTAKSDDGTEKALFATAEGRPIESVLMRFRDRRRSICVSSQSGCPLTCTFCATGTMAFGRNLTTSEILDQALHFRRIEAVDHCVFMGMGEPLMNFDAVIAACERLPEIGIAISHTTVSTVGWLPGIERLCEEGPRVRLAISLHAPDDAVRATLMPVNRRFPLEAVMEACKRYRETTHRRVFIEYLMLHGVNDAPAQADELASLLHATAPGGFHVNLIVYNPTAADYRASDPARVAAFRAMLDRRKIDHSLRQSRGRDIDAACGQLAVKGVREARAARRHTARTPASPRG